ncbi:hypothetical protein N9K58_08815 [Alphaproteobacteria bacterium]|nr:hypothetical protein [Alphaproteobacteria bacterium]
MSIKEQPFIPLSLGYLPSSALAKGVFKDLFTTLRLDRSNSRKARPKDIATKTVALHQIVSSLLIHLKMTEGRYCSRTIEESTFTGEDFGRDVFNAVIQRLEEHKYIKFERGNKQAYSGHLSRVYLRRPLVRLFKDAGVTPHNILTHFTKRTRHSVEPIHMVEAKTPSEWVNDHKVSGKDVKFSKLKKHQECQRQVSIMQELNAFLYKHDLKGTHNTSFNGLKRQFNNHTFSDYLFDQGGRLYCQLAYNNYQSLSGHERSLITVNGEAVVEMDIHACALSITHALFKIPLPDRSDLYHLEGVERDVVKSWINLSLTIGKPLERWPETVIEDFKKNKTKHKEASFYRSSLLKLYPFIGDLKQQNIGWARLQFEESEVILSTMQKLMKKGIPSYPVHDSIIVPETSAEDAMYCLKECFRDRLCGEVILKVSD